MKHVLALVLVIALVADLALFFGIGFGVGALSVTAASGPAGSQGSASYTQSNYTGVSTMYFSTSIISYSSAGVIPATGYSASSQSTSFDVSVQVWDPIPASNSNSCGNSGQPVWAPGQGANWGALLVTYDQPFTIEVGGTQYASNGDSYAISMNGTTEPVYYCLQAGSGLDFPSSNLQNGGSVAFDTSFTLVGLYSDARLTATFIGEATYCDGSAGGTGVCGDASNAGNLGHYAVWYPNGGINFAASASINTWSGQASIVNANPGAVVFNGGTASFDVSTGYNGPGSCPYTVTMSYPAARGGGTDPNFAAKCVPNFELSPYVVSWTIPQGTSVNSSTPGWNTFIAVLSLTGNANYYAVVGYAQASIAISPLYQPAAPVVIAVSLGPLTEPQAGNTEDITVWANESAHSGPVGSINLIVYYANVGTAPGALPACGAQWVSGISCPSGITMSSTASGSGGLKGTFSFTVDAPAAYSQGFWIAAQSENQEAQPSNVTYLWVSIAATNCKPGSPGCPGASTSLSLWQVLGPALLSAAIILAGLIGALWAPGYWRYLIAILPVVLVILLYLFAYTAAFAPGGPLYPTG